MNKSVKISFLSAIAGIAMLSGCGKDPDPTPVISITTQPASVTVTAGSITQSLTVAASVTEKATPAYQWYSNTSAVNTGGTAVSGARGTSFAIPTNLTAAASPYYYYCVVSATGATSVSSNAATVTVNPAAAVVPNIVLTLAAGTYTYNGAAQKPAGTVTADGATLTAGTDYDLAYSNNTNAGTATVVATGKGTYAGKTDTKTFEIAKFQILVTADDAERTFWDDDPAELTYTVNPPLYAGDAFTGKLSRVAGTEVNTYDIEQGNLSAGNNYAMNFAKGTFEIYYFKGDGTSAATAYEIGKDSQLKGLRDFVNANNADFAKAGVYYKMTADINLNSEAWTPIGTQANPFKGSFDGSGKIVSGLNVTGNSERVGLFGAISGGNVQNLGVEGSVSGSSYVGAVAGWITGSSITNCFVTGTITGSSYYSYHGGVVGSAIDGSSLTKCYSTCTVNGGAYVGGIAGSATNITNCYVTGTVTGTTGMIGGVAGDVGTITNCYATGAVNGAILAVGGVAGRSTVTSNCAALNQSITVSGDVVSYTSFGRVVGQGTVTNCISYSDITLPAGATGANGTGWSKAQIQADGTLGGRFPNNGNPWTTANGKLPGFGAAIDLPDHLKN